MILSGDTPNLSIASISPYIRCHIIKLPGGLHIIISHCYRVLWIFCYLASTVKATTLTSKCFQYSWVIITLDSIEWIHFETQFFMKMEVYGVGSLGL